MSSPSKFHRQCLCEIARVIRTLGLQRSDGKAIDPAEIKTRRQWAKKQGDGTWIPHRGITIHPEQKRQNSGTNRSEDVGYPVGVTMMVPADHSSEEIGTVTDWEEIITRAFINQRLSNVTVDRGHVCISTIDRGDFAKDFDDHKYEVSALTIIVWARETRS